MTAELLTLEQLLELLPDLIAQAVRAGEIASAPVPGVPSMSRGTVESVSGPSARVQFDDDAPGVFSAVQLAAAAVPGDRVVALLEPQGGAVVVGNGGLSGTGGGGGGGDFIGGEPWTAFGTVLPALTTLVPTHGSSISAVELTLLRKPFPGRHLIVDLLLDGLSVFSGLAVTTDLSLLPTYLPATANPFRVVLPTAVDSTGADSMMQGVIKDGGSAGWLRYGVLP